MVFSMVVFMISWLGLFVITRKKKCILFILTSYIGIIFALMTDLLIIIYPLWKYPGTPWEKFGISILNAFGLYFVVVYLFLHLLPKKQTMLAMMRYIFFWTLFCISYELLCLSIGFIEHDLWWNTGISYVADWILFITFYAHHKWMIHSLQKRVHRRDNLAK